VTGAGGERAVSDHAGEEPVIAVKGLTKRFGERTVVDHVDLTVMRGQIYGFLGPNGSGKTTTIRLLCGLLVPDDGEGTCLGYDIRTDSWAIKQRVGYMTQRFSVYEDLTPRPAAPSGTRSTSSRLAA
jgi:ABC-2 type transport system ATP-binding protein